MTLKTLKCFLIFVLGIQTMIVCRDKSAIRRASPPSSLGVHSSLYIGQRVKAFLSEVQCVEDDSDHHYCCDISYGNYFNYLCINEGCPSSRVIKLIALYQSYPSADPAIADKLESNAKQIIEILIGTYGNNFEIADDLLKRPKLVWKNDSCLVSYSFLPESLYNKEKEISGEVLNAVNRLVIFSTDTETYSAPFQPSHFYTKESLGLN